LRRKNAGEGARALGSESAELARYQLAPMLWRENIDPANVNRYLKSQGFYKSRRAVVAVTTT